MRVLIVEPAGELWGSERALLDLIDSAKDLEIAVCCPPSTPLCAELVRRDVRIAPYFVAGLHQKSRWRRAQAALGVIRACMTFRPDVVHLNQSGAYRVALPAATPCAAVIDAKPCSPARHSAVTPATLAEVTRRPLPWSQIVRRG